jgi:hypothetical protein
MTRVIRNFDKRLNLQMNKIGEIAYRSTFRQMVVSVNLSGAGDRLRRKEYVHVDGWFHTTKL